MKVLMINSVCGIRSTGRICTDLASELEAQGHEVKIAYGREEVPEKFRKYAVRIGHNVDIYLHALKARLTDGAGFGSRRATEKFIEWVKQYNPDVIHLHNIHGYYINVDILFAYLRTCGKKIIWTLHDCWAFTGHSAYCDAARCDLWKTGCHSCAQMNEYPKTLFDRSHKNWKLKKHLFSGIPNMKLVTPSYWLKDIVQKSYLNEYPVEVIYNGLDMDVFKPTESDVVARYGLTGKKVVLGVAAVWDKRKGLDVFVQLRQRLSEDYAIVIIGLTHRQIKKLPDGIVGISRTSNIQELVEWYSSAYVYFNASVEETMGLTTVEAQMCGTPVIVFDKTAIPELVRDEHGYIVNYCKIEDVVHCIEELKCKNIDRHKLVEYEKVGQIQKYIALLC